MKRTCYSFEPSGHRFLPLDAIGDVIVRLYCPRCSRVVSTAEEHNRAGWDFEALPTGSQLDFWAGNPLVIRKEN